MKNVKMTGEEADLQESASPQPRADLDHRALPAIQAANHTQDPQTGDVGAVLQRNDRCGAENRHHTPEDHVCFPECVHNYAAAHQGFISVTLSGGGGSFVALMRSAGVSQETQ